MADVFTVVVSANIQKILKKIPDYIRIKFFTWVDDVIENGILEICKIKGYHDEPLMGYRVGQRSVRPSKSYRIVYKVVQDQIEIDYIEVLEVHKHDY